MTNRPPTTVTPGWNDPPTLEYNTASSVPGRTRLNLNKRVAFPLQGIGNQPNNPTLQPMTTGLPKATANSSNAVLPPPPTSAVPPLPKSVVPAAPPSVMEQLMPDMQSTEVINNNNESTGPALSHNSGIASGTYSTVKHL